MAMHVARGPMAQVWLWARRGAWAWPVATATGRGNCHVPAGHRGPCHQLIKLPCDRIHSQFTLLVVVHTFIILYSLTKFHLGLGGSNSPPSSRPSVKCALSPAYKLCARNGVTYETGGSLVADARNLLVDEEENVVFPD